MIFSPLCSNLFYGSFQKLKRLDKIMKNQEMELSKSDSDLLEADINEDKSKHKEKFIYKSIT